MRSDLLSKPIVAVEDVSPGSPVRLPYYTTVSMPKRGVFRPAVFLEKIGDLSSPAIKRL